MLPDKWAIRRSPSNYKKINKYFSRIMQREYFADGTYCGNDNVNPREFDFLLSPKKGNSVVFTEIPEEYTEITWEQFRIYVLKEKIKKVLYEIY